MEVNLQTKTPLTIAVGKSRKETKWKNTEMSWEDLIEQLSHVMRTNETFNEYNTMPKSQRDEIKDVGGFVGGTVSGRRNAENVGWRSIITLDADYADQVPSDMGFACVLYTTHSHQPESPRFRLVIPLKRAISPEEYPAVARQIAADINIEWFDDTTYEPHRLMYFPSTSKDGDFIFKKWDGEWVDPDEVLGRYKDWRDISERPVSSRVQVINKKAKIQSDPLQKTGTIGAFCRTYSITQAIETFLSDVYESCGDRYTYRGGTTYGGLVIYDDVFAYSHHATDPTSGKLCNAFDLVRIHRFGEDFEDMIEFAEGDESVQRQAEADRLSTSQSDFAEGKVHPKSVFFIEKRFIPRLLGNWFMHNRHGFVLNGTLYLYQDGVYRPSERAFYETATSVLRNEFQPKRANDTLKWIEYTVDELSPERAVDTGEWLNVKNGLLNLKTGAFKEHTPEYRTTIQLPVEYDPEADCPHFKKFMSLVLNDDCIPIVEEMIGYCLTPSMQHEKAFFLYGDGSNGKGTLIAVITALLGAKNVSDIGFQQLSENRFASAHLFGKLANMHADLPPKYINDSSAFKTLVSGDQVYAEEKFKKGFHFRNRAKLIFSMNEIPSINDTTYGFFRRQGIIPFPNRFHDRELRARLFTELSGLLNLALKGLQRLDAQGFSKADSVEAAQTDYRKRIDSAYSFLTERCQAEGDVGKQQLYDEYKRVCLNDWGVKPVSQIKFNSRVKQTYTVTEYRDNGIRRWRDLKLENEFLGDG